MSDKDKKKMKMQKIYRPTWVEINLNALEYNYRALKRLTQKDTRILSVVKADAYGHGIVEVAKRLKKCGVDYFGVVGIDEAIKLRKSNITSAILILENILPVHAKEIIDYNLTQTVCTNDVAIALNNYAKRKSKKAKIHIKVDTGMGRLGVWHNEALNFIRDIRKLPFINIEGVYSHFPSADTDRRFTNRQIRAFKELIKQIKKSNIHIPLYHIANSIGLVSYKHGHLNMARPGIALYGIYPTDRLKARVKLKPVMSLKSRVMYLKKVLKGRSISYGRTFIAKRPMTVATIPVGYKDGYFRNLSNKSQVLIKGKRCPVLGRVCMDQMMVDASRVKNIKNRDTVVLMGGASGNLIRAEDIADLAGTIGYEVVCSIGSSVVRIYRKT